MLTFIIIVLFINAFYFYGLALEAHGDGWDDEEPLDALCYLRSEDLNGLAKLILLLLLWPTALIVWGLPALFKSIFFKGRH